MGGTNLTVEELGIKKLTAHYSATGMRYTVIVNGLRSQLDDLATRIKNEGITLDELYDTVGSALPSDIIDPNNVICRTPQLTVLGEGSLGELEVTAVENLDEGDTFVGNDTGTEGTMPANWSARVAWEPNDVDIKYGHPFRAGMKWDLEQTLEAAGSKWYGLEYNTLSTILGNDASTKDNDSWTLSLGSMSLLAVVNLFESGTFSDTATKNAIQAWIEGLGPNIGIYEWLKRYQRGQTSFRTWIPIVTITKRYRTLPDMRSDPDRPGTIGWPGDDGGPPSWAYPPTVDAYGNEYRYMSSGPQVEFSGDEYVVEWQYRGFLLFDEELYKAQ